MKKFSKYNVAKDLVSMCSYKEAIKVLNTGKVTASNLHELEARINLYCAFFKNYLVTEADKKEFKTRKDTILGALSAEELVEYEANVKACMESFYYDAVSEFQNRIDNINPTSTDGKEENPEAFDLDKLEKDIDYTYPMTRFSKLINRPISRAYKCNDDGVYIYDKKKIDWVRVCDPLIVRSLPVDYVYNCEYIELQYYDHHKGGKVTTITIPVDELSKGKYEVLQTAGIVVDNPKALTQYFNDLKSINHKTERIPYTSIATSYDFVKNEDGTIDYTKFVGVDEDVQIVKKNEFYAIDQSIANRKGTVKGFIDFLTEVSKGFYELDFQIMVAASLVGVTQSVVNGISDMTAPISIFASGRTSIGKNLLAAICNNIWCAPTENSLRVTSASSTAYMNAEKNHLGVLPLIMPDVQDLYNRLGESELINIIFDHSNGQAGGKCHSTGTPRPELKWKCPFVSFGEVAMLGNAFKVSGGAAARVLVVDLNYNPINGQKYLTVKSPKSYLAEENKNFGVYGPAYVQAIKKKKPEDIFKRFIDLSEEYADFGAQDKQANILALLNLTLEILREADMVPSTWQVADVVTLIDWLGIKKVEDPTDVMYEAISEHVFKDSSYVPSDDKYMTIEGPSMGWDEEKIFNERSKEKNQIRGRLLWQRKKASGEWEQCMKAQRERTLLLIPNPELQQLFKYIEKEFDLTGFAFDKKRWLDNGWLLAGNRKGSPYIQRDTFKISVTKPRDAKNREDYYAIVLKENKDEGAE